MASTDTARTTNAGGDADNIAVNRDDQQERLAHADDQPDWNPPNQGMRTHHVTTPNDAQAEDQRSDEIGVTLNNLTDEQRDKLGTPANAPTPVEGR